MCLGPGPPGSFDEGGVSARCVVADPAQDGHWIMFYEARDAAGRRTIGQARSANGETWTRSEQPVFEPGSGGGALPCAFARGHRPESRAGDL